MSLGTLSSERALVSARSREVASDGEMSATSLKEVPDSMIASEHFALHPPRILSSSWRKGRLHGSEFG